MIYLASPYTHIEKRIKDLRCQQAMKVCAALISEGKPMYSPIVHCHEMAFIHSMPTTYEFWREHCLSMVDAATELYILKIDGWQKSVGLADEVRHAWDSDIRVHWLEHKTMQITPLTRKQFAKFFMLTTEPY